MKYSALITATALLTFASLAPGCKESPTSNQQNVQSAEDNALVESEFASIFEMVDDDATENPSFNKTSIAAELTPACVTRTIDSVARTVTFDFGSTNCLGKDGNYRRGKLIAQFTGKYKDVGSQVTITLQDYYVNDMKVTGTKTIERAGLAKFNITVTGASVTTPNGTILWSTQRTIERIEGNGTLTPWDDVYQYTGSASGTNRQGESFMVTVDQPLKKKVQLGCLGNFIAGKLTITGSGGSTMTVDYDPIGGEPCDKIAQVTINGVTRTITLR